MRLQELKDNRVQDFERLKDQVDRELYELRDKSSQRRLLKRLEEALYEVDRKDVWAKIRDCSIGQKCGSLWCPVCRNAAAQSAQQHIQDRIRLKGYQNKDLLHLTAPVGLALLHVDDVNRVMKEEALRWKRIRKKNEFWIEATYEFELVNYHFLMKSKGSDLKKIQMRQIVESSGMKSNEFLFVHWHGVTDISQDEVDKVFGREYFIGSDRLHKTSSSGLYVQGFRSDQDLMENIRKVSSYPFKSVYRFKHNFKGSDFSNGEYLTTEELGRLVSLYDDIQGRQWRKLRRHCRTDEV
jgi:DNA mismatch repair ATPase MutS